ncbi:HlyU family transcriptional regulator [Aliihoeflea sp. PC F10.4]
MSFWKKLFGGSAGELAAASAEPIEYKGFTIRPQPFSEAGQYQTCAIVTKEVAGELKEHRLIRADRFPSLDDATDTSVRKAKQVIDEQGEKLFG